MFHRRHGSPHLLVLLAWLMVGLPWVGLVSPTFGAPVERMGTSYRMRRWTTEDGLPKNTVTRMLQSRDGYLWVGTRDGLARFDGVHFRVFTDEMRIESSAGWNRPAWPPEFSCEDLMEDSAGRVWVRLPDGLVGYDRGRFQKFSTRSGPLQESIQTVIASRNGGLWIGTQNHGVRRFENGRYGKTYTKADGLASDVIGLLREDPEGRLWIACGEPSSDRLIAWQRLDPATGKLEMISEVIGESLPQIGNVRPEGGRIWISTPDMLLCWERGQVMRYANPGFPSRRDWTGDITSGGDGAIWFAPPNARKLVRMERGRFDRFDASDGVADTDIRCHLRDREGNLWIGLGSGGLQRLHSSVLQSYATTNVSGARRQVDSISPSSDGGVWLGTWQGLLRWKAGQLTEVTNSVPGVSGRAELKNNVRPVLEDRRGKLWFGLKDFGLFALMNDRVMRVGAADDGRSRWTVRAIHEGRDGRIWVGTDSGLLEQQGDAFRRWTTRDGMASDDIIGIRDCLEGGVWVGTTAGLNQVGGSGEKVRQWTMRDGLLQDRVNPLLVESDGSLWLASARGLNRLRAGRISTMTSEHGLPRSELLCLLDDGTGSWWANTAFGIVRMRKADLLAVADGRQSRLIYASYGKADGAPGAEGVSGFEPTAIADRSGQLWFATTWGALTVKPEDVRRREITPLVLIEEVLADDRVIYADGAVPTNAVGVSESAGAVQLTAGRAQGLEIRYTATSFIAPERVQFRYRLEGADNEWREAGTRRVAFYTNLRPGSYRFLVEASNQEGTWSARPAEFRFYLAPQFWQTWPFYACVGLGVVGLAGGIQSFRLRVQRRILRLQQRHALEQERARIAKDLHDDLGANLTGIALKADLAQRQVEGPAAARLGEIAASTRALVDEMRGTVWALNPKHDTLEGLAQFLAQQVEEFVTNAGMRCRLELPGQLPNLPVPSPARYQLFLVVKEALHNAIKHSRALEVRLTLRVEEGDLCLELADDGIGFDPSVRASDAALTGGHGLVNMRDRVESLGGRWSLDSRPGAGTRVNLRISTETLCRRVK